MPDTPRFPVHVVYGGAHLFRADTAVRLGVIARETLERYAPTGAAFARALGIKGVRPADLYRRVTEKLRREPVEDYRIDFEDGFGRRTEEEEDRYARGAAAETAAGMAARTLPAMIGIRVKPFAPASRERALRTLELYLTALAAAAGGTLPGHFVVTLPKLTAPEEVSDCAAQLGRLEAELKLGSRIGLELMIETPRALLTPDGRLAVPSLIAAAGGRCTSLHFGPYDYTAALGIVGAEQQLDHPACDVARHLLQLACAGTDIRLSDGPVNVLPIPPHRTSGGLSAKQRRENRAAVVASWRRSFGLITRSLRNGFYQGWDLHPAQLPVRFAAVFAFFLEQLEAQASRYRAFAGHPSVVGSVFDDAATVRGLVNFFLQGVSCGALTPEDLRTAGVGPEELQTWLPRGSGSR